MSVQQNSSMPHTKITRTNLHGLQRVERLCRGEREVLDPSAALVQRVDDRAQRFVRHADLRRRTRCQWPLSYQTLREQVALELVLQTEAGRE